MQSEMKAMVYYGENDIRFENRKTPKIIQPTDAIIKLTKTTICGTDLGIWKGKNPEIKETAINKDGCFIDFAKGIMEMNSFEEGEGRMVINNNKIDVFDGSGALRVRIGTL